MRRWTQDRALFAGQRGHREAQRGLACAVGALCVLTAWLSATPSAWANFGDLHGFGSQAGGTAGAQVATVRDATSLFYNPAGMSLGPASMTIGFAAGFDDLRIRMKPRPGGYDLPDRGSTSPAIPSAFRLSQRGDVTDIPNLYQFLIAAHGSFGITRLRLGVAVMLPLNQIGHQRSHFADEREQYFSNRLSWELLGERSEHQTILAGASWMVLDWLSVGVGLSVLPSAVTDARVYLPDAARQDDVTMTVDNQQDASTSVFGGLRILPADGWQIGLSARSENAFSLRIRNYIQIKGFQTDPASFPVVQDIAITVNYIPAQASLGVAWNSHRASLSAEANYQRWSAYIDGDGGRDSGFEDTVALRLGGTWIDHAGRTLRAGLAWEPSPVPAQTGRTSYVDNDRIRLGFGSSHPLELLGQAVELGWFGQVHWLVPRDTDKAPRASHPACAPGVTALCDEIPDAATDPLTGQPDPAFAGLQTGSPGFPGWQSWGVLWALGVDLRWRF